jgi:hypothetical protein
MPSQAITKHIESQPGEQFFLQEQSSPVHSDKSPGDSRTFFVI